MIKISKKHPMLALYKKELASIRIGSFVAFTAILLLNLIFKFSPGWVDGIPGNDVGFGLSFGFSWMIMIIWLFWASFRSLSQEWDQNTNHILMSIPISGMRVLYVKLASVLTFLAAILIEVNLLGVLGYYINSGIRKMHLFPQVNLMIVDLILLILYFMIIITVVVILIFFSYILSRIAGRFSKIFTGATLFACTWLFFRGSFLLSNLIEFTGTPDVRVFMTFINRSETQNIYANPAPIIASLIFAGLYFMIAAILYDKVLEV